jgi:hypothetical protein
MTDEGPLTDREVEAMWDRLDRRRRMLVDDGGRRVGGMRRCEDRLGELRSRVGQLGLGWTTSTDPDDPW